MALSLSAVMAFGADSILGFSLIQQTTPKSKGYPCYHGSSLTWLCRRILMACIRSMGECPCPRCITPKSMVHWIGTEKDRHNRIKLARVDDLPHRFKISQARNAIYQGNYFAIDSAPVERLLKPQSLVPTTVILYNR
jgi:hypothetical protein